MASATDVTLWWDHAAAAEVSGELGIVKCKGAHRVVGTHNFIIVLKRRVLPHAATVEFASENKSGRTEIAQNIIRCCHRLQQLQYLESVSKPNLIKPH